MGLFRTGSVFALSILNPFFFQMKLANGEEKKSTEVHEQEKKSEDKPSDLYNKENKNSAKTEDKKEVSQDTEDIPPAQPSESLKIVDSSSAYGMPSVTNILLFFAVFLGLIFFIYILG